MNGNMRGIIVTRKNSSVLKVEMMAWIRSHTTVKTTTYQLYGIAYLHISLPDSFLSYCRMVV